jgi:hypothetical protein
VKQLLLTLEVVKDEALSDARPTCNRIDTSAFEAFPTELVAGRSQNAAPGALGIADALATDCIGQVATGAALPDAA